MSHGDPDPLGQGTGGLEGSAIVRGVDVGDAGLLEDVGQDNGPLPARLSQRGVPCVRLLGMPDQEDDGLLLSRCRPALSSVRMPLLPWQE